MSAFSKESLKLHYCIYRTLLTDPRIYYHKAAKKCGVARNTFTKHWEDGLEQGIFFSPQIRPKMFSTRKEYIYLVQTDDVHELFEYYKNHPHLVYLAYTLGKFDLLVQTSRPLEVIPNNTILWGSRSNYSYPDTPRCTDEEALNTIQELLDRSHEKSHLPVDYPDEPHIVGHQWGWKIYPHLKYNLRPNYTWIVKTMGMSFTSFYRGYEYLLKVCTVLLPYYPHGFTEYSQQFFVIWSDYEQLICNLFGSLPSHVSITKLNDALLICACIREKGKIIIPFFKLFYKMLEIGIIDKFWTATPVFHWKPDP